MEDMITCSSELQLETWPKKPPRKASSSRKKKMNHQTQTQTQIQSRKPKMVSSPSSTRLNRLELLNSNFHPLPARYLELDDFFFRFSTLDLV